MNNWRQVLSWQEHQNLLIYFGFHSKSKYDDTVAERVLSKGISKFNTGTLKRSELKNDYGTDLIEIPVQGSYKELLNLINYLNKTYILFIFPSNKEDLDKFVNTTFLE